MASRLEETTTTAKKLLAGCGIIVLIVILYTFVSRFLEKEPPPYDPLPQVADQEFGQLPNLEFESLELVSGSKKEFKIETTDGKLPSFYPIVNVFKTKTPHQSLTAHDDAVTTAGALDFTGTPRTISSTELKWTRGVRTLKINKLYGIVELTTDYTKDPEAQKPHLIQPDNQLYIDTAKGLLAGANIFPAGYEHAETAVTHLTLDAKKSLKRAKSSSEANFIRIDFFQQFESLTPRIPTTLSEEDQQAMEEDYTTYSYSLTDNPNRAQLYIILGGNAGPYDIYELKYTNWEIETPATYYLLPPQEAWEKIQADEGYLRSLKEPNTDPYEPYTPLNVEEFLLTNVEIAYYTSNDYIEYIQPVYKFSGLALLGENNKKADFVFYYPAGK